ncbi:Alpha/Beta hydrolase protein [Triangularia setosa]|uniref:Alpha/Beta hydrolase protein n=1 Tax=Triangularia setosa TaxID=2587417 RepID=A0AAN6W3E2_9PEZI|nr:Alpha/Beta hydrolase protein [Podospora setosa]
MDSDVKLFSVRISGAKNAQLHQKLEHATYPDQTSLSDNWAYGVPVSHIKRLVSYWKDGFDWRQQEAAPNRDLPQYTTLIHVEGFDPLKIHRVHKKGSRPGPIPLLLCHGWPGSFNEVAKIIPLLTAQTAKSIPALTSLPHLSPTSVSLLGHPSQDLHSSIVVSTYVQLLTDDEILTWISIYHFSDAGPEASCRIYYENAHSPSAKKVEEYNLGVKLGVSTFPKDLLMSPSSHCQTLGPLVFEKWHDRGGHFAAWEVPELLVEDLRVMFGGLVKSGELKFAGHK